MNKILDKFKRYRCYEDYYLESDGYIGIPVKISVLFDYENIKAKSGFRGTDVILYIIGANIERIGTESDFNIISSMLERGYIVCVIDYFNNEKAISPSLEWSVQKIRVDIIAGKYFEFKNVFEHGYYYNTFVVPSGYNVSLHNVYWSIDKHCADGTLEKIVEIWNNDFRGANRNVIIKWTDKNGNRKPTQKGFDESDPVWLNENGEADECGEYIKIKYTKAVTIADCVQKDGTPIDFDLYMHIIYPTAPEKNVPLMCLSGSSEHLASGTATSDRPQFSGFAFLGYAVATYDHGYVPMARNDHYGYYDGNWVPGHITGDNLTYSIQFYNDKIINTAAIRYLRYLALSGDWFKIDTEKIGVYGNSKGGCMSYLGAKNPEKITPWRIFPNHYGETRYDNGKTETQGNIRGGEEQPWQSFKGKAIPSNVQLIYASCGGGHEYISKGHAPTFISCNREDNSYYGGSNDKVNACRTADVPALWFEIDKGHTLASGVDCNYGVDTYSAFFDFAGYYLKNDAVKVAYSTYKDGKVIVKFTGAIPKSEILKVKLNSCRGDIISGEWKSKFGNTEWSFLSEHFEEDVEYSLYIPVTLMGDNGKTIAWEYEYRFVSDGTVEKKTFEQRKEFTREIPLEAFYSGEWSEIEIEVLPSGERVLSCGKSIINDTYFSEKFYHNPITFFKNDTLIKNEPLNEKDIGRHFKISMKIYDTLSRYIQIRLNSCTSNEYGIADYKKSYYVIKTLENEWQEFSFDYTVYEPSFGEVGFHKKELTVSGMCDGDKNSPIYFKDFVVTEF